MPYLVRLERRSGRNPGTTRVLGRYESLAEAKRVREMVVKPGVLVDIIEVHGRSRARPAGHLRRKAKR